MTIMAPQREPEQCMAVYPAAQFRVVNGANLGDAVSDADELILGDSYMLVPTAEKADLRVTPAASGEGMAVARGSQCGRAGAALCLDACATLMSPAGRTAEALIFVELSDDAHICQVWLFPLAELAAKTPYALVAIDRQTARRRFAESACVSFTAGTRITLADGRQWPVERLAAGDRVLTRDNGVQNLRWIGQQTVRAVGEFAPVRIAAGALNNSGDLVVSPNHRLFVYQRDDRFHAGQAEVWVRADNLVNADTVTRTDGGFVDYYQLLFDHHEIIYAEGIAAESMIVDVRTRPALPGALRQRDGGTQRQVLPERGLAVELSAPAAEGNVPADLLRRASAG